MSQTNRTTAFIIALSIAGAMHSLVLSDDAPRAARAEPEVPIARTPVEIDRSCISEAGVLYSRRQYSLAFKVLHHLAERSNSFEVAEEARFLEAEYLFCQQHYASAAEVYCQYLTDFPGGTHRQHARNRMLHIADFWLDATRSDLREGCEVSSGVEALFALVDVKVPRPLWTKRHRALDILEQVVYMDLSEPPSLEAARKAGIFSLACGDEEEATHFLKLVRSTHPSSEADRQAEHLLAMAARLKRAGEFGTALKAIRSDPVVQDELRHSGAKTLQKAADTLRATSKSP